MQVMTPLEDTRFCKFHPPVKAPLALRALQCCDLEDHAEIHLNDVTGQ